MGISTVGIVGLGTMGAGIAEVVARHGYEVVGIEADEESLELGRGRILGSTARAVSRGKLSAEEQDALLSRVSFTTDLQALAESDLVVEAVSESLDLKKELFGRFDAIAPAHAILATNTSSLSVTDISVATGRPANVVGIHFFNPAPVQSFVEIVRTVVSSQDVVDEAVASLRGLFGGPSLLVASGLVDLGNALRELGRPAEAEARFAEALELAETGLPLSRRGRLGVCPTQHEEDPHFGRR